MAEKSSLLRTVGLVAGSLLFVAAGVLANLLVVKSKAGIVGSIVAIVAIICLAGIMIWRRDANSAHAAVMEDSALKRIRLILQARQTQFTQWNVDIDVPLSIVLNREGRDLGGRNPQTRSAFIASLTSNPRCTIVTGVGGSGKSALLTQLALQMTDARVAGTFRYTPLMLHCRGWDLDSHLSNWVTNQTRYSYGITANITQRWLNRGAVILIIDGLDDIPDSARKSFVPQLNGWLNSAAGGRAVVSCRTDSYFEYFKGIVHEQVANLEPLPYREIQGYIVRILNQRAANDRARYDTESLLSHVISPDPRLSSVSTPLLVRLLADGVIDMSFESFITPGTTGITDPAAMAVELGDKLRQQGNERGAIESYMAAVNSPASQWRSIAGIRASLLMARSGEFERARKTLHSALATEIEHSFHESPVSLSEDLSGDERAVLRALSPEKTLDAFQVSSLSSVPPGRCNNALRSLRDRSLVEITDADKGEPRFRRSSSLELVEQ